VKWLNSTLLPAEPLFDDLYSFVVVLMFEARQQLAEYAGVEVNNGVGDQARTFVP
jgi:hypothetical protein